MNEIIKMVHFVNHVCDDDCETCDIKCNYYEIAKQLYDAGCRYQGIEEAKAEIEILKIQNKSLEIAFDRLEAENERLAERLKQVLLSIDTVKEMNAMRNIDEQRKQAVKEFAEKLKSGLGNCTGCYIPNCFESMTVDFAYSEKDLLKLICKLLKEYEK